MRGIYIHIRLGMCRRYRFYIYIYVVAISKNVWWGKLTAQY